MPDGVPPLSVDEAVEGADVVMMLRLTRERLARAAPNAVVMHPGPMNRGVEIDPLIADDPERSLITLQVEMGVAVRMACLEMLIGGPT